MSTKRLLLDTGVWISYFGNRMSAQQSRIDIAKNIINYCLKNNIELFYCPYVENELSQRNNTNKNAEIKEMNKIANKLPAHIGNDTWDKIHIKWEDCGSLWNNHEEVKLGNKLEKQLPDKKNKSNRIDRNIVITAVNQKINFILHENPNGYKKINLDGITFIDLLKIKSLNDFIEAISKK